MVHSEAEIEVAGKTYLIRRNVPFQSAPPELIEQINEIDVKLYGRSIGWMNNTYWNLAFFYDGVMVAFVWGIFCPVERILLPIRMVIDKNYRDVSFVHAMTDKVYEFGEGLGAFKALLITNRADAWFRLLKPKADLSDVKVLEKEL